MDSSVPSCPLLAIRRPADDLDLSPSVYRVFQNEKSEYMRVLDCIPVFKMGRQSSTLIYLLIVYGCSPPCPGTQISTHPSHRPHLPPPITAYPTPSNPSSPPFPAPQRFCSLSPRLCLPRCSRPRSPLPDPLHPRGCFFIAVRVTPRHSSTPLCDASGFNDAIELRSHFGSSPQADLGPMRVVAEEEIPGTRRRDTRDAMIKPEENGTPDWGSQTDENAQPRTGSRRDRGSTRSPSWRVLPGKNMQQDTSRREDAPAPFTRQAQVKPFWITARTATLMPLSQPHARNLPGSSTAPQVRGRSTTEGIFAMKYGQKVSLEKTSRGTRSLT